MKRLFAILMALVLLPISCFAISLEELQNNPSRYVKASDSKSMTLYVDVNSIKSLRYAPPYYTMQAKVYTVDFLYLAIVDKDYTINYDYTRSANELYKKVKKQYPYATDEYQTEFLVEEVQKDCGVYITFSNASMYEFDGKYLGQVESPFFKIKWESPSYRAANFIFYKYYNQYFSMPIN